MNKSHLCQTAAYDLLWMNQWLIEVQLNIFFLKGDHFTWVNDLILFIEGHSEVLSFPLGSLNIQVALLDGEGGDALVMSGVELSQVLPKEPQKKKTF